MYTIVPVLIIMSSCVSRRPQSKLSLLIFLPSLKSFSLLLVILYRRIVTYITTQDEKRGCTHFFENSPWTYCTFTCLIRLGRIQPTHKREKYNSWLRAPRYSPSARCVSWDPVRSSPWLIIQLEQDWGCRCRWIGKWENDTIRLVKEILGPPHY